MYPILGLFAHGLATEVIQFPLFTGAGKVAGFTQAPGAQLLLIRAGEYVKPIGFWSVGYQAVDACQMGSRVPVAP